MIVSKLLGYAVLVQIPTNQSSELGSILFFFTLSIGILILFSLSGKVGLGIQIPGVSSPLPNKYKEILREYFFYYNRLPANEKRLFERKMQQFIYLKEFIPRHLDQPTDEMKVLISACAVQLTLGLPKVFLSHFKRILIYPDDYYSTINRRYHRGEVNPKMRAIVLSWNHFVDGYIKPDDGRNLGLHEMAHALHLENRIFNGEFKFFVQEDLDLWNALSLLEIDKIRRGEAHMFRDYAATNKDEFFAVAVENFFERPREFGNQMPAVYEVLVKLLKQDPREYILT